MSKNVRLDVSDHVATVTFDRAESFNAFDMAMARDAGVRALGVDWGYHEPSELIHAGAEFVAATVEELKGYLLR